MQTNIAPPAALSKRRDIARLLGVSERTVCNLTRNGDIPSITFGRSRRYDAEAVLAAVKNRSAQPEAAASACGAGR